jgi:hypothetical protein
MDVVCAKHAGYGSAAVEYAIGNNFRGALGACVVLVVATNTSSSEDLAIAGVDGLDGRRARARVAIGTDACGELRVVADGIRVVRHGGRVCVTSHALLQALKGFRRGEGGTAPVKVVGIKVKHISCVSGRTGSRTWHTVKRQ